MSRYIKIDCPFSCNWREEIGSRKHIEHQCTEPSMLKEHVACDNSLKFPRWCPLPRFKEEKDARKKRT